MLGRWIDEPPPTGELAGQARQLLERLGRATQLRFPVIGDLARSVRFRWFDQPAVDAERADVLAGVRDELAALAANGGLPDRADRIEALAAIPEQIVRFLAERLEDGVPAQEPMLEVLARRHYREYDLHGLESIETGRPPVRGRRLHPRRPAHAAGVDGGHRCRAGRPVGRAGRRRSRATSPSAATGDEAVVDLYLHWPDAPESADEVSELLRPMVAALPFVERRPPGLRRGLRRRQPAGRLLRVPARPTTAAWPRTTSPAASTRWSAAGSTCGGCATST